MNILKNYLTEDECQQIIDSCGHKKRDRERFEITKFDLPQSVVMKLKETLGELIISCAVQYYELGDRFAPHRDHRAHVKGEKKRVRQRVLSMSILLNDAFEGGDLMIEHEKANISKRDAVVFTADDLHWVTGVYEGTRWCLAVWGSK